MSWKTAGDHQLSDDANGWSPTKAQTLEIDTLAPHVMNEIAKIYEGRFENTSQPTSSNLSSSKSSKGSSATSTQDTVVIPRAYVRPTRPAPSEGSPIRPKTAADTLKELVSSPLPLMRFNAVSEKEVASAKTITGEKIRFIPNQLGPSSFKHTEPLCDPMYSRRIAKWFIKRSFKEQNWRQVESYSSHFGNGANAAEEKPDLFDVLVYESLLYAESASERNARNEMRVPEEQIFQERYDRLANPELSQTQENNYSTLPAIPSSSSARDLSALAQSKTSQAPNIPCYTPSLRFDGEFESGNIEKVVRVVGRESLMSAKTLEQTQDYAVPGPVDQEYDITLRRDINTDGNIQWYYFSATTVAAAVTGVGAGNAGASSSNGSGGLFSARSQSSSTSSQSGSRERSSPVPLSCFGTSTASTGGTTPCPVNTGMVPVQFPLRVRFNVINMQKKDSLYNYGMKPATYSENQLQQEDWVHSGEDICYYRNGITSIKPAKQRDESSKKKMVLRYQYTLTFTYTFERPDTVFFAHTFPYTYSDLQLSLCQMEQKYRNSGFFHQRTLCETLAGNSCDILSISERSTGMIESKNKPAIVLTGRVHPGESNSSFIIQGFLDFITSNKPEAVKLRKSFVFHIIPMLNPDGVIHGNYRCSLAATDLNRRYGAPHPRLHPTILAKKTFLKNTAQNRNILLYLDLHGHSKLKNAFVYGCDITQQSERITKHLIPNMPPEDVAQRRIFSRVFPKILSTVSNADEKGGYFSYKDCSFAIDKSKHGTGRVVCWRELNISASYTVEVSFCGNGDNREGKLFKRATETTSSGYGVQQKPGALSVPSSSSKSSTIQRSTSTALLSDMRSGGTGGSGIAYDASAKSSAGGDDSDGSVDEAIATSNAEAKGTSSKSGKLGKKKSSKSMKRSTTTPNLVSKAQSLAATEEEAFNGLLERYRNFVHYRKEDLLNMGRDIGIAIYHFANLSHSSVEQELKIATKADAEEKAKARRLNVLQGHCGAPFRSSGGDRTSSAKESRSSKMSGTSVSAKNNRIANSKAGSESNAEGDRSSTHQGHMQSAAWAGAGEPDSGEGTENELDSSQQDTIESDYDLDGLDSVLHSLDNDTENGVGGPTQETAGPGAVVAGQANASAGIAAAAADDVDFDEESEGDAGSDADSDDVKGVNVSNPADLALLIREYAQSKVNLMESDMAYRSLLKAGVFSSAALESAMQAHPTDFLTEQSSQNIGMRMKCEYRIRKGLRFANDITLTDQILRQHDASYLSQNDEGGASSDGSESQPSVDNVPANRMLKSMKKFKDTSSMVAALRKAAVRKKKKELELERRLKRKESKKLAKQVSESKKAVEEAAAQAAKEAKEAREAAAIAAAAAAAALAATEAADSLKERGTARRKGSIFQSAPKHAPLYRLAPDDTITVQQPLPMKLVNFKAYDGPNEHYQPVYHANQSAPSSIDTVGRPRPKPNDTGSDGPSPHAVALSMSSLTSAAGKLYFAEEPGVDYSQVPGPPSGCYFGTLPAAQSSPSPGIPARRNSLHNSFINPALLPGALSIGQDALLSGQFKLDPSPKSAVRPTVHSMAALLPAAASSGDNINGRDRESTGTTYISASENSSSGRVRPKSGSATSAKRRGYNSIARQEL